MGVAVAHSTSMTTCRSLRKDILQLILTPDLLIECSAMIFLQLFAEDAPVVSGPVPVEDFLGIASSFLPLDGSLSCRAARARARDLRLVDGVAPRGFRSLGAAPPTRHP